MLSYLTLGIHVLMKILQLVNAANYFHFDTNRTNKSSIYQRLYLKNHQRLLSKTKQTCYAIFHSKTMLFFSSNMSYVYNANVCSLVCWINARSCIQIFLCCIRDAVCIFKALVVSSASDQSMGKFLFVRAVPFTEGTSQLL